MNSTISLLSLVEASVLLLLSFIVFVVVYTFVAILFWLCVLLCSLLYSRTWNAIRGAFIGVYEYLVDSNYA